MKKFITLMTIAMVAILATSCGTARQASKAQKTDATGFSETSQYVADMTGVAYADGLAMIKDHSDVSTSVESETTQRTTGNTTTEVTKTKVTTVVTSNGRIEGGNHEMKKLKGRELEGHKYGSSVKLEGATIYDENFYKSDNN